MVTNYEGYVAWGEYPFAFAACLEQEECYRLMLSKGANHDLQDINGCTVAPEHVEDLRKILVAYVGEVRAHEPGCLLVRLHQEQGAENHFVVYAEFADQETRP